MRALAHAAQSTAPASSAPRPWFLIAGMAGEWLIGQKIDEFGANDAA